MKLVRLLVIALLLFVQVSYAQEHSGKTAGRVVNTKGEGIPYANVIAFSLPDSVMISGCVTDLDGRFEFAALPTPNYLSIKCIGYESKTISEIPSSPIVLNENSVELSEVVAIAPFTTRKRNGEISVRMQGNPIAKGKSTIDALRYIQGVEVIGDQILVNGKEGTLIFLGNRQITQQELNAIPTSMIKNIEIIPNAGVSFGHKAKGGAIRVILRDTQGVIGGLEVRGQADRNGFVDALLSSVTHYQKGKYSFYNNFVVGAGNYHTQYDIVDKYTSHNVARETFSDKKSGALVDNFTFTYQPNNKHSLQLNGGFNLTNNGVDSKAHTDGALTLNQKNEERFREVSSGLNYIAKFGANNASTFSTNVAYLTQQNKNNLQYILGVEDESHLKQQLSFLQVQPRLDIKLKDGANIESGIFFDYLNDDNRMDGIDNPLLQNIRERSFIISGGDFAPWIEYNRMVGKYMYVQLGLRYQETLMKYADRSNSLANYNVRHKGLYPDIQMQYLINPQRQSGIALSYKRDFSLPNYGYYNPITTYKHEKYYSVGNQQLKPELFHIFGCTYHLNPQWMLNYLLKSGKNMVHLVTHLDDSQPDLFFTRPENIGRMLQHEASVSYTNSSMKHWQSNNRLFVRNRKEALSKER